MDYAIPMMMRNRPHTRTGWTGYGWLVLMVGLLGWDGLALAQLPLQSIDFQIEHRPRYTVPRAEDRVVLRMLYGQSAIRNPEALPDQPLPYRIDLVYTDYPADTSVWRTTYARLMNHRLEALYSLQPDLKTAAIEWHLVGQTGCTSAELARRYFHGFVLYYREPVQDTPGDEAASETEAGTAGQKPVITLPPREAVESEQAGSLEIDQGGDSTALNPSNTAPPEDRDTPTYYGSVTGDSTTKDKTEGKSTETRDPTGIRAETADTETQAEGTARQTRDTRAGEASSDDAQLTDAASGDQTRNGDAAGEQDTGQDATPDGREEQARTPEGALTEGARPNTGTQRDTSPTDTRDAAAEDPNRSPDRNRDRRSPRGRPEDGYRYREEGLQYPQGRLPALGGTPEEQRRVLKKLVDEQMDMVREILRGEYALSPQDSVVTKVLEKHRDWQGLLCVTDWTGSMYQYGAQVLRWHHEHLADRTLKHLVLFNDGDDFRTRGLVEDSKAVGKTGGIYFTDPDNLDDVMHTMEQVMLNGDGGEIPENNLEAVIKAMQEYEGDFSRVVMIADNTSGVRDLVLLYKVRQPIHIILCGDTEVVHPDYVSIAWKTGGSIMTIKREILFDGPESPLKRNALKIGKTRYELTQPLLGRFEIRARRGFFERLFQGGETQY